MKNQASTITVARRKPRNPLVAASLFRQAGQHRRQRGALRREAQQQLRRELARLGAARERADP
jgi:hypothetical protein